MAYLKFVFAVHAAPHIPLWIESQERHRSGMNSATTRGSVRSLTGQFAGLLWRFPSPHLLHYEQTPANTDNLLTHSGSPRRSSLVIHIKPGSYDRRIAHATR